MRQDGNTAVTPDTEDHPMGMLDTEELRWRTAVEQGRFGVWDLDPRLDTVRYSPRWMAHLGFAGIEAADSTSFWRCRVHPDDLAPMLKALRSHLDGFRASYEARFRIRSNGSGYRLMLSRGLVVERDVQGQALRMVGTMVDLTDRPALPLNAPLDNDDAPAGLAQAPWTLLSSPVPPGLASQLGELLDLSLRQVSGRV